MGRLVTVKTGFTGVSLPSTTGVYATFNAGDSTVLTDAEWAALPTSAPGAYNALTDGGATSEPLRPTIAKFDEDVFRVTAATQPAITSLRNGVNVVTGIAAGQTYAQQTFLSLAAEDLTVVPSIAGAKPGHSAEIELFHVQGAVVSVAPTGKNWFTFGAPVSHASSGTTNASPTVTDAAIAASDTGKSVVGAGIPANTYVGTVTPGVSYLLSSSPTSQVNVNATATATVTLTLASQPQVFWPGGTVTALTATVGAVDYYKFQTFDGGKTFYVTNVRSNIS